LKNLKILVCDDEFGMRMAVARALAEFTIQVPDVEGQVHFDISQAGSGEDALEMLANDPVDILLLDHKLPGISGLDVLADVAEKYKDTLTIMITAYASLETAITATKRGAYDFLAKPFTPDELKAAIRKSAIHLTLQRQARKLAEEKRQVRFQLISVVAHELKAPLGAIEGYLYLLRDKPLGADIGAYDKAVSRSIERLTGMRKLITDLLDLTRIESGQKKRELAEVDAREVVKTAIETVQPDADARRIAITLHADAPVMINADPGELEIVCNNLLTNAVKYNKDDGKVDVTLTDADDHLTIEVKDTGIGMKPEDVQRLFGDFVRIKTKETRQIPGSGLGLSILKKISQLYQGGVNVASEYGEGTTFTVMLKKLPLPQDDETEN